ncbi:hypothetical protein D3C77_634750 [compost metagenome]
MNIPVYESRESMEKSILHKRLNDQLGNKKLPTVLCYFIMNPDLLPVSDLVNEHVVLEGFYFGLHGH